MNTEDNKLSYYKEDDHVISECDFYPPEDKREYKTMISQKNCSYKYDEFAKDYYKYLTEYD